MSSLARTGKDGTRRPSRARRLIGRRSLIVVVLALLLALLLAAVALIPEHILFRQRLAYSVLELDSDREIEPLDHETYDGLTLRSWFVPPRDDQPTIVYFPGRDGDVIHKPGHLLDQVDQGYGIILVGYRGYGGNPGFPSEMDMHRDVSALLNRAGEMGITTGGIILYGYSMGTVFAANAGLHWDPLAVVLEAPLSNFLAAVRQQMGAIPGFLVRTGLDNLSRMPGIRAPILLLAGGVDTVTPPAFAYALAQANPAYTTVELVPEANHLNIIRLGGREKVRAFLDGLDEAGADSVTADMES